MAMDRPGTRPFAQGFGFQTGFLFKLPILTIPNSPLPFALGGCKPYWSSFVFCLIAHRLFAHSTMRQLSPRAGKSSPMM